ncbi:MAG: transporter related protein [Acidimicrobiales bacterium]|nr:transporter related protein [Acidimicrobiales bacterium]
MTQFLQFLILGVGVGAGYALLAEGIVVVYRGSGILNFSHGALAMVSAFVFYELHKDHHWGVTAAFITSVALTTLIGVVVHLVVMRPLRNASPVVRVIATLGVLIVLQSAATLRYGSSPIVIKGWLPRSVWHAGSITILYDRVIMTVVALVLTLSLWALSRYTTVGLAISAVSENRRSAAALGWSPDLIAGLSWGVGSALAGVAGIFIAPLLGSLTIDGLTLIVITALAAALIGNFSSFPLTLVGALVIGAGRSILPLYYHQTGAPEAIPLLVIVVLLALSGRGLPLRGFVLDRLPRVGKGRVRLTALVPALAIALLIIARASSSAIDAFTTSATVAIMMLSIVVLTGYCGQLSLAQYAIGGVAALIAGRLVDERSWGLIPAGLVGIAGAVIVGSLLAIPALRTRGINLAVVTLSLGLALEVLVFNNSDLSGGFDGISIRNPNLFGWSIDTGAHADRYALVVLTALLILGFAVATMRRGRVGRRLIAVRTNERAAAALGINVYEVKLYAFALGSSIAATAGIFIAFSRHSIVFSNFSPFPSIVVVAYIIIGSVGFVIGAAFGSLLIAGGVFAYLIGSWFPSLTTYIQLAGGILLILNLMQAPNGIASLTATNLQRLVDKIARRPEGSVPAAHAITTPPSTRVVAAPSDTAEPADAAAQPIRHRVRASTLEVKDLTVRFGGVTAVRSVSFTAGPGEIVGLIGPNGAGKTTVIDAITGFVTASSGTIRLDGRDITRLPAYRRSRLGIGRSFQSLELFDDVSVEENLRVAFDPRDRIGYLTSLVRSGNSAWPPEARAAIHDFGLEGDLERDAGELPYARRRLVAVARAVAAQPSVLLLDEPAAGLDDKTRAELTLLIRQMSRESGMAILLVEHDMAFVMSLCDRIAVLDAGAKIADGSPAEIRTNPLVRAAYLGEEESASLHGATDLISDSAHVGDAGSASDLQPERSMS